MSNETLNNSTVNATALASSSNAGNKEYANMTTTTVNTDPSNTTSTLAQRQDFVKGFANNEDVAGAIVVGGNKSGLLVHLTDDAPMAALLIGVLPSEQNLILDAVAAGVKVALNVVVVEANSHSVSKSGNIRARLVVRLAKDEVAKLRTFALSNIKAGDTFQGSPGTLLTGDNGPWGLPVQSGRVSGLLHVNATDGRMVTLENLASQESVELTVLDVDHIRQRVALTNRSAEYVKAIHEMAANVGKTVEGCEVTGVRGDIAFVKVGGLTGRVVNKDGSVAIGDTVTVRVDACDIQRSSWQVTLA